MQKSIVFSLLVCFTLTGFTSYQSRSGKGNQRAFYECSAPMDVNPNKVRHQADALYFQFNTEQKVQGLEAQNFVWLKDNPKGYFEAYLVNTTDSSYSIRRQDGSLIMIQEAQNQDGEWAPIEYWVYSGCGNSYFNPLLLEPGKCVMVPIKKYRGSLKTQIRLKLKIGETIFYSAPFAGSISATQFKKESQSVNGILYYGPARYLDDGE